MPETSLPSSFSHPGFQGWLGVARAEITPPTGIYARNWGASTHEVAEGIHRPLTMTALTFQQQEAGSPLVLISLDLGWWRSSKDEWLLRGALLKTLNLAPERVMISFTHTHAGPALCRAEADKPGGHLIALYLDELLDTTIRTVRQALALTCPATLEWSYGTCGLAQNRDLLDPERPRHLCGFNPAEGADDTLLVGRVTGEDGTTLATLVNYACHPTTLAWENRQISPDFVGAMRDLVEAQTNHAPCLFLQGASGDLAPREQYTAETTAADAHGRHLGYAVLATLEGMMPPRSQLSYSGVCESGAPLALWKRESYNPSRLLNALQIGVEFELQALPGIEELRERLDGTSDRVQRERLHRKLRIREGVGEGTTTQMPFWIWQVGDCYLVGHPNEAYSVLQTQLRSRFAGRALAVMNVVNGHYGYLPPAERYDQDLYAVWQSPFARGSLERLIEACTEAIPLVSGKSG